MKKRMLSICLALSLCLGLLPGTALAADTPVYLALGDSITSGYAPDGKVESPFADQVAEELGYALVNKAEDGETSATLLGKLGGLSSEIASADLITITIGGNDLMNALYEYLAAKYTEPITVDEVKEKLMGGDSAFLIFASAQISGFANSEQAAAALGTFTANLGAITGTVKSANPDAAILVATQYNPYEHLATELAGTAFASTASQISDAFDAGVHALNAVIGSGASSGGYQAADVYTAFQDAVKSGTNPCNPSYTAPMTIQLDFHPNQTGHNLIAQTILAAIGSVGTTPDTPSEPATTYDIWVGGIQVTSNNAANVLGDGTVTYNPDTNTLTLTNAHITTAYENEGYSCCIYAGDDLTIHLDGDSTVQSADPDKPFSEGVCVYGNLTVTGDGSLKTAGIYGIYAGNNLTVNGSTVTSTSEYSRIGIWTSGYLLVTDGHVSGTGRGGIRTGSYLIVDGGTVTAKGSDGYGLLVGDAIETTNGSTITATADTGRAIENSSVTVNRVKYDPTAGATQFQVVNGVVTGAVPAKPDVIVNQVNLADKEDHSVPCGGGTAVYDPDTNTLTLTNATITTAYTYQEAYDGTARSYGIYAEDDLTIRLVGTSTVESSSLDYGVSIQGDLTVTGDGSLTAKGSRNGIRAENLTVDSGSISGTGTDESGDGIYAENLTVNGGSVTGAGEENNGIYVSQLVVTGGSVTATGDAYAIYAGNSLTVDGGMVKATGTGENGHGILCIDTMEVNGGSVLATGVRHGIWVSAMGGLYVNGGALTGTGTGTDKASCGIYVSGGNTNVTGGSVSGTGGWYGIWTIGSCLTVTGGTVTGKGDMVAILGTSRGTGVAAETIIALPAGCLAGYALQTVEVNGSTYASIVPAGGQLEVTIQEVDWLTQTTQVTGAVTEITLQTQQNPDGSTTTTVTGPDGPTSETTRYPDGSGQTTVDSQDGSGSVTTVDENGQAVSQVTLSQAALSAAQTSGQPVVLPMPAVPVTADRESAAPVTVTLPGDASVPVEIPVEHITSGIVAVLVLADGTEEVIRASLPTGNGVAMTLSDGDTVKLVDNSKEFTDVSDGHWAADHIDFTTSRELFVGTSSTTFAPDMAMSRAMAVTVLARLEGVDTTSGDTWYETGRQWAMDSGISDGANMEQHLSREQLATMLWRYAGSPDTSADLSGFSDAGAVSSYAQQAMAWCVEQGILKGIGADTLSPQEPATRAQMAAMLMRFCEKTVSW